MKIARTLSKVASKDKANRLWKRLVLVLALEDISTGFEEVNTGGLGVSTGSGPVSSARGQREGKAPMIVEETQAPKRTKEQIQQEEASLAEAIRLQTLESNKKVPNKFIAIVLTKKIFGNMKRGFRGVPRPLLPEMLPVVAVDQSARQADQAVDQPSPSEPLPSSSHPPVLSATTEKKKEAKVEAMNPTPLDTKSNIVANWKIFQQGERSIYQIIRANGADTVYMSFGAILKDSTREDLIELYRLVMQKYGTNRPEDAYDRVLWSDLKTISTTQDIFEDISTSFEEVNTGFEKFNTGGLRVSTGSGPVSFARGQREGKAPMIVGETQAPKRTKEQIQQEEAKDWDAIRAKLEANAELTKNVLGKELSEEDFAKKMVELVNQRKKFFADERAKARRRDMEANTVKEVEFKEVKEEFDKLVKQVESFVPMNIEATKAQLKRYGEELQTEISKKQMIDDKDVSVEEKVTEVKEEEPVIRTGKRKKQKARKGINVDKSPQGDSETDEEESIIRANGADAVYMSFGAMLKDFTREDLIELYRLVIQKYGTNRPEDAYDRVLWSDLRTMFDLPLNEDAIWSLPLQQKIIS
ncbi:hypothetical protein Tco_0795496 [Tanacetum coccineum]